MLKKYKHVLVPELNMGQLVREIGRSAGGRCEVQPCTRIDGHLLTPMQIVEAATAELAADGSPSQRGHRHGECGGGCGGGGEGCCGGGGGRCCDADRAERKVHS